MPPFEVLIPILAGGAAFCLCNAIRDHLAERAALRARYRRIRGENK